MMMINVRTAGSLPLTMAFLVGCGDETGELTVTTYGEDFIEVEIPTAAGPDDEGFVDGFRLTYDRFLISLGLLTIADRDGEVGAEMTEARVFDMTRSGPHAVARFSEIGARRWDDVSLEVEPPTTAVAGNATADDVSQLVDGGWSSYVEGSATDGQSTWTFAWGFDTNTRYEECREASGQAGVVVPAGGSANVEITVHGDHFVYDDLQSDDAVLRFRALAEADANADGEITLEELDAVSLDRLPSDQYGTGGDGSVVTLRDYVTSLSSSLIHFQGEGDCVQRRR
jgi:hypothetical protein